MPDDLIEAGGMDPRFTPLDVLMRGPDQMHRDVAYAMEYGDDEPMPLD